MYRSVHKIVSLAIPSLIAIVLLELVSAEFNILGPFFQDKHLLIGLWNLCQIIPALIFAYISDRSFRKEALMISQFFGFLGCAMLYFFGVQYWALLIMALTFNPLPVARAALLDNFPQYSSLKIVSVTFIAQYITWVFYKQISAIEFDTVIIFLIFLILTNIFLTYYFFTDRRDIIHCDTKYKFSMIVKKMNKRFFFTIIAFMLAELTMYMIWFFIEYSGKGVSWIGFTNFGILIGICGTLLYSRLPHMSIITLMYTIGFGISLVATAICKFGVLNCQTDWFGAMSYYSVVSGMYIPFVMEAVINMFGKNNRAIGSALVDLAKTLSMVISSSVMAFLSPTPTKILFAIIFLFLIAVCLQKHAEKEPQNQPS